MLVLALLATALAADPPEAARESYDERLRDFAEAHSSAVDDERRFDRARLAMSFGQYDVARQLLEPLADARPMDEGVQTNLGLAWMGEYYARHGLSEAAFARVQGLAVDPEGALAGGAPLKKDEIGLALARGFALAEATGTRGGSTQPESLSRALIVLDHAHRIAPDEPRTLLHLFVAETEAARWHKPDPSLAARRAEIEASAGDWPADLRALAFVDLGVYDYTVARDPHAALAMFAKAEALGSRLGAYDHALLLACDPAFADRRSEAIARFERFAKGAADPERAVRAGLLPTATAWPYGAGSVELSTSSLEIAGYVASIRGTDAAGAVRTPLGELAEVRFASGTDALISPGKAAWIVLADAPTDAVADADVLPAPQAVDEPVFGGADVERVVVRLQTACLADDVFAARPPARVGCPLLMEVKLSD